MSSSASAGRPSLKVPRENNRFLCFPDASDSKRLLDRNRSLFADHRLPLWLQELRRLARNQTVNAARAYLSLYAPTLMEDLSEDDLESKPWVVGGHQPELFHPGVWFKNFLMSEIGKRTGSVGLQVIVDHDVAKSDTLRIPTLQSSILERDSFKLAQRSVPLPIRAESEPRMPWHATRRKHSVPEQWDKTIEIVAKSMSSCGLAPPVIQRRQSLLYECIESTTNIGDAFSQFRHRIEMDHGILNLEVPIGHLCDASAFGLFVHHCVSNAESLWEIYNVSRDAYRARHRIRNQGQPVLELQRSENWLELPFWIYRRTSDNVVRNRLWVRKLPDHYQLSDNADPNSQAVSVNLPLDAKELPERWADLVERGICIRPRALMTTMYLRCFVADLFVHGIGGGTYDELTDDILSAWLGMVPPTYLISSASLFLPFRSHPDIELLDPSSTWNAIQRDLHLMRSVPERFLDPTIDSQRVLRDAHALQIASVPNRGKKLEWHIRTSQIKKQIEVAIESKKRASLAKLEELQGTIRQTNIMNSREFSFVLFEEQDVVRRLTRLANAAFDPAATGK